MAYADGQWRFHVRGTLLGEIFDNTWCAQHDPGDDDPQEFADILHQLYEDIYASGISDDTKAVAATMKNLGTGLLSDASWAEIVGATATPMLPTQCAIRVTLAGSGQTRGGPFIAGWHRTSLGPDGQVLDDTPRNNLVTALETFWAAADAAGWSLLIDKPTTSSPVVVSSIRVGHRFDVIRKRANDLPEAYVMVTAP